VTAGSAHSCGVRTDSTVACWGFGDDGRTTAPAGAFQAVAAGDGHTCALALDGTVSCWGADDLGQASPPNGTFAALGAGWGHTCGVRTDGVLTCWGGQVRHGDALAVVAGPGDPIDPSLCGDEPGPGPFPDVGATHTFYAEITWLADTGITGGFADGTFRPGAAVTRQAMAAFLRRYDDLES
jgi:hypothetical protein